MDTFVAVYPRTDAEMTALKVFCLTRGIKFTDKPEFRKCSEEFMTPTKPLASFLGPPYLNRYGHTKPIHALECITTYAKMKGLYKLDIEKEGITLDDELRRVLNTGHAYIDYQTLIESIEMQFHA